MALTDDQRAMLRLLAQRDEGYEDIAALMGLSVDEVRAKVKEALDQLAAEEGAAEAPPAPAPEPEPEPPAPLPPPPPSKPEPPASEPVAAKAPKPSAPSTRPPIPLPSDGRGWAIVAGGAALVLILIVLLATGTFSGGSDSSSTASDGSTTTTTTTTPTTASNTAASAKLTQAILAPVDGGSAAGRALFGRVKKTAVLEVLAKGLTPSPQGHSYTVWLYRSSKVALRIGGVRVGKSGGIAAQFPIPAQLLAYVANGAFDQIDISLTDDAAYREEVAQAKKQNRLPRYAGTDVLRGKITGPGVKAASGG